MYSKILQAVFSTSDANASISFSLINVSEPLSHIVVLVLASRAKRSVNETFNEKNIVRIVFLNYWILF